MAAAAEEPGASAAAPPGAAQKRARGRRGLPVYVCEYHDEALRCLHHAIRRRAAPFDGLTMVHLDAHPDLSASTTMPADTVFKSPHEVYFALRTDSGGIAQWILPAVYGGHFRCVWWVRPPWAEQIADGDYDVAVGGCRRAPEAAGGAAGSGAGPAGVAALPRTRDACTPAAAAAGGGAAAKEAPGLVAPLGRIEEEETPETIRISCPEPYFVEDGLYCPAAELTAPKPLRLLVSPLPGAEDGVPLLAAAEGGVPPPGPRPSACAGGAWTLDVCLDFFACGNPFLNRTRPHISAPFAAVQNRVTFRQQPVRDVPAFLAERDAFDAAYSALLRSSCSSSSSVGCGERAGDEEDDDEDALVEALGRFLPEGQRAPLLADLRAALESARDSELEQILEAGDMVTLPLHAVTEDELKERLAAFQAFTERVSSGAGLGSGPRVVTIARSVVDGFCPMRQLCTLEEGVLEVLRRCFGALDVVYSDELDVMDVR